jgi:hypothetical protein
MKRNEALALLLAATVPMVAAAAEKHREHKKRPPRQARALIAEVARAAQERDFAALRRAMSNTFSDGYSDAAPAANAVATWRQHPELLDVLVNLLFDCGRDNDRRVHCPPERRKVVTTGPSVRFERRGGAWRFVAFERP